MPREEAVLELAGAPESASRARHAATELAMALGAEPETVADIAVAVTEAVANVVVHAYRDRPDRGVEVEMRGDAQRLDVTVSDRGVGLRPRDDSPGLGLGLGLMAELADRFEVTRNDGGGTRVLLSFVLP